MTGKWVAWLSWSMWMVGLVCLAGAAVLATRNPPISTTQPVEGVVAGIVGLSSWVGFGLVGALVVSRGPSNRIGWILCGITFSVGLFVLAAGYGRYALVTAPGTLPFGKAAAWLTAWGVAGID